MIKTRWLDQKEKWLEQSNHTVADLTLFREAKQLVSLQSLLDPNGQHSVNTVYEALLDFEARNTDKKPNEGCR